MTVYFAQLEAEDLVKIGYTAGTAPVRIAQLQTGQPKRIKLIGTIPGGKDAEAGLHKEFEKYRVSGEWFRLPEELMEVIALLIEQQASWYLCRASSGLVRITTELRKENEELRRQLSEKAPTNWMEREIKRKHKRVMSLKAEIDLLKEELRSRPGGHPVLSVQRDWLIPALLKAV